MKKKAILLLFIFAIGVVSIIFLAKTKQGVKNEKAVVGLDAPIFNLRDLDNRTWRLSDLKGKVVLLNFWASWCDSCKEENPSLQKLISAEKGNDNLVVLSVLYDDDPLRARQYMKENNLNFAVLIDHDGSIAGKYGITGVPETYIIDRRGTLKEKIIGPTQWDSPEMRGMILKLTSDNS